MIKIIFLLLFLTISISGYEKNRLLISPIENMTDMSEEQYQAISEMVYEHMKATANWDIIDIDNISDHGKVSEDVLKKKVDLILHMKIWQRNNQFLGTYITTSTKTGEEVLSGKISAPSYKKFLQSIESTITSQFPIILEIDHNNLSNKQLSIISNGSTLPLKGSFDIYEKVNRSLTAQEKSRAISKYESDGDKFYLKVMNGKIINFNDSIYTVKKTDPNPLSKNSFAIYVPPVYEMKELNYSIAVIDLNSSLSNSKVLSDILRHSLFTILGPRLLERNEMESILKEQGITIEQLCNEQSCAVEVGAIMGAEKIVFGSINILEDSYILNLRLVNIETGLIEKNIMLDRDTNSTVLKDLIDDGSKKLMFDQVNITQTVEKNLPQLFNERYVEYYGYNIQTITEITNIRNSILELPACMNSEEYILNMNSYNNSKSNSNKSICVIPSIYRQSNAGEYVLNNNLYPYHNSQIFNNIEDIFTNSDAKKVKNYQLESIHPFMGAETKYAYIGVKRASIKDAVELLSKDPDTREEVKLYKKGSNSESMVV